jgi:uncharacterized protein with GYD domain
LAAQRQLRNSVALSPPLARRLDDRPRLAADPREAQKEIDALPRATRPPLRRENDDAEFSRIAARNGLRRRSRCLSLEAHAVEGNVMTTFVTLYKYTDQGMRTIKDAPARLEAAKKAAAQAGMTIKETLWLQGEYDFMVISEASDEIASTAFALSVAKMGNIRGQTMRAFTAAEMAQILAKVS